MKYNALFYLAKDGRDDAKLRLRVRFPGGELSFNLGYRVLLSRWSTEVQRCARGSFHGKNKVSASVINGEIQKWEDAVRDVLSAHSESERVSSADLRAEILAILRPGASSSRTRSLLDDFDEFVKCQGAERSWSLGTYKKMGTVRGQLLDFGGASLSYADLNEAGMQRFCDFLLRKNLLSRTIEKYIKTTSWFLRWADAKGLSKNAAATGFRAHLKNVEKRVIFLSWAELMRLYEFEFAPTERYLSRVRDRFCFCCFTGLRFSDMVSLLKVNVIEDAILLVTRKTNDTLRIELNKYSRAIMERYIHAENCNTLFPRISSQRYNEYLKEACKKAGFDSVISETFYRGGRRVQETHAKWELMTSHAGRRTFICNSLALGIPPEVVMKWTGHSDYKAMRPYIDVADEVKKSAMALFDKK